MRTALFSAYKKTDALADFARELKNRGWEILASAGTMKFLAEKGIQSTDVATIIGPPILGHRVVTLSREIHAGILARASSVKTSKGGPEDDDEAELKRLGIPRIDLVYVDLYPLQEEIARAGATEESVIEKTDIGGPTLLRAAAKGRRIVLSNASQFQKALDYIDVGREDKKYLIGLAAEAESVVLRYSAASEEFTAKLTKL